MAPSPGCGRAASFSFRFCCVLSLAELHNKQKGSAGLDSRRHICRHVVVLTRRTAAPRNKAPGTRGSGSPGPSPSSLSSTPATHPATRPQGTYTPNSDPSMQMMSPPHAHPGRGRAEPRVGWEKECDAPAWTSNCRCACSCSCGSLCAVAREAASATAKSSSSIILFDRSP